MTFQSTNGQGNLPANVSSLSALLYESYQRYVDLLAGGAVRDVDVGGVFHASAVGHPCQRYVAYHVQGFPPLWPLDVNDRFTEGRLHDAILKEVFNQSKLPVLPAKSITRTYTAEEGTTQHAVVLTGCPDVVIDGACLLAGQDDWHQGAPIPVELKAVADSRFTWMQTKQAYTLQATPWWPRWVMQVQCYAALLQAPLGVLVVKNKESGELWQQVVPAMAAQQWQVLIERLGGIMAAIGQGKALQGHPKTSQLCRECPYQYACHSGLEGC